MKTIIGSFTIYESKECFDDSEYREVIMFEDIENYSSHVNLNKDNRFSYIDFRFPPDEKKFSVENFKIKTSEYNSFFHRKDCVQPVFKLHTSTIKKLIETIKEL